MLKFERKWLSYTPQAVYYIFNHDGKEEIVELDIEARLLAGQLCVANSWNDTEAEELVAREAIVENIIPVDDNGLKKKYVKSMVTTHAYKMLLTQDAQADKLLTNACKCQRSHKKGPPPKYPGGPSIYPPIPSCAYPCSVILKLYTDFPYKTRVSSTREIYGR